MRSVRRRTTSLALAGLLLPLVPALAVPGAAADPTSGTVTCDAVLAAPDRESAFAAASEASGVPADLLKAVSYMESRWDQHAGVPSIDDGYGVFNLLDHAPQTADGAGKGAATALRSMKSEVDRAAALTGLSAEQLKSDAEANICGGAALLASYQQGSPRVVEAWHGAVARMSDMPSFTERVFDTLRKGAHRTTDGGDVVSLAAHPGVEAPQAAALDVSDPAADCPTGLGCEWLPAPYAKDSPTLPDNTGSYGNHDQADRTGEGGPSIEYIVIHDTETSYEGTVRLVQDPTYLAWQYSLRSSDGHIANHLEPDDVGWHAGNWYVNMHSIGLEHEGWAGTAGWFTEAMYQTSAELVAYLADKYDIPVDRAHIIGHDQIPGVTFGATRNVHWDPGPYWDWDHYFELLGAPIGGDLEATTDVEVGDVVEVRTGYEGNVNPVTGCQQASPGSGDCVEGAGTNFVLAYQEPSLDAPYAKDPAWRPGSTSGTTYASDVSARVNSGHKLVVAQVEGDWLGVWWAGSLVWIHNPADRPVVVPSTGQTVTVAGTDVASIYGRAYPEPEAYEGTGVPVQALSPLEYTVPAGQSYVVSDDSVVTDYYRAVSFDGSAPGDRTDIRGELQYYQLWYAHRHVFVQAAQTELHDPVVADVEEPAITGTPKVGWVLRADAGTYLPSDVDVTYQWLRDGEPVAGATGDSYHLTGRDLGAEITVQVTATAPGYTTASFTSDPTSPVRPAP